MDTRLVPPFMYFAPFVSSGLEFVLVVSGYTSIAVEGCSGFSRPVWESPMCQLRPPDGVPPHPNPCIIKVIFITGG